MRTNSANVKLKQDNLYKELPEHYTWNLQKREWKETTKAARGGRDSQYDRKDVKFFSDPRRKIILNLEGGRTAHSRSVPSKTSTPWLN